MFVWGAIATLHATASSYAQLMAMRFFLGLFESGFFPGNTYYIKEYECIYFLLYWFIGVIYFLTLFYKKSEMVSI